MKLITLHVTTQYPRGYGRDDIKMLSGSCEIRTGLDSWNTASHTLSPEALEKMAAIALADWKKYADQAEIPDVLVFSEDSLPPEPEPEPAPAPEAEAIEPPLHIETENGEKVTLRPVT